MATNSLVRCPGPPGNRGCPDGYQCEPSHMYLGRCLRCAETTYFVHHQLKRSQQRNLDRQIRHIGHYGGYLNKLVRQREIVKAQLDSIAIHRIAIANAIRARHGYATTRPTLLTYNSWY